MWTGTTTEAGRRMVEVLLVKGTTDELICSTSRLPQPRARAAPFSIRVAGLFSWAARGDPTKRDFHRLGVGGKRVLVP